MVIHIIFTCILTKSTNTLIYNLLIYTLVYYIVKSICGMLLSTASMSRGGHCEVQGVHKWLSSRFHSESTLRFIPEGCEVPRVLIHLLSRILRRHWSRLYSWSIIATIMSVCECPSPLKCTATGDSSVLLCTILKRWPLTLRCSGWPVLPTYCWPHLLQVIK